MVNPNDAGDGDSGPNQQLNFPVITAADTNVTGTACANCVVEVFLADRPAGANGSGKTFLASATAAGDGSFSVPIGSGNGGLAPDRDRDRRRGQHVGVQRQRASTRSLRLRLRPRRRPRRPRRRPRPRGRRSQPTTSRRTVADGLGAADTGGSWALTGTTANFAVDGSVATIAVPATRAAGRAHGDASRASARATSTCS